MAKSRNTPEPDDAVEEKPTVGKGRPTPTRREREAANMRPLVSNDRKEARARYNAERDRMRAGMAAGEERFLPARDKGPQRRYVRDYVDARFSLGEIMIPVMFAVILLTLFPDPLFAVVSMAVLWGFFILAVLDCIIAGRIVTKRLEAKFGDVQSGTRWYTAMRCLQMRPLRLPKPQVKRREFPS